MKMNEKGFTGLEIGAVVVIGLLVFQLIQPILPGILKPAQSTTKSVQKEVVTSTTAPVLVANKPIFTQNADGTFSIIQETKTVTSTSDDTTPVQPPLWQRIIGWFVRLGFLGLVLALLFPGAAVGIILWIKNRFAALKAEAEAHKSDLDALKADTQKIVLGLEKAFSKIPSAIVNLPGEIDRSKLVQNIEDTMKAELEKFYNDSTKDLVDSIKNPTTNTTTVAS